MKHCLILSMCAVALAAFSINTASADVDVALNLRYTDPADPNQGGTWTLVAISDAGGIAGVVARIEDGTIPAAGTVGAGIGHDINGNLLEIGTFVDPNGPDFVEFVYGQDPNGPITDVLNVGLAGAAANQGADPLHNSAWDDASVIATGSFLGSRPLSVLGAATEYDPNSGAITLSSVTGDDVNVRGDSVSFDGLSPGDVERDFDVDADDLAILLNFFGTSGRVWDEGNLEGADTDVDADDLAVLLNFFGTSQTPPAIGAIPEPTSAVLALFAASLLGVRRRS